MILPAPQDPGYVPVWECYVAAQAVRASLGLIWDNVDTLFGRVEDGDVVLCFGLRCCPEAEDEAAMDRIVGALGGLLGEGVRVLRVWSVGLEFASPGSQFAVFAANVPVSDESCWDEGVV
jgi:hypothetical protein